MTLKFNELRLIAGDILTSLDLSSLLSESVIQEQGLNSDSLAVVESERNFARLEILSGLIGEILKYRPLPF